MFIFSFGKQISLSNYTPCFQPPDLGKLSGVLDTIDKFPANAPLILIKVSAAAMITDCLLLTLHIWMV
jgi:hypothetical protein